MGYLDWYKYMKNPYEKQNCIVSNNVTNYISWIDLITGNNFMLDNEKHINIINSASKYIVNKLKNAELDDLFEYLRGNTKEIENNNYDLMLFPQLPYIESDSNLGAPRLMDFFSVRTGLLFAILGGNVNKEDIRKVSYLSSVYKFLNEEAQLYIEDILKDIDKIKEIKEKLSYIDLCFTDNNLEDIPEYNFDIVKGGVVKVKEYLLETNKIKEIRGASMILDKINREIIPREIEKNFIH